MSIENKLDNWIVGRHQEEIHGGRELLTHEKADERIGVLEEALKEIVSPIEYMRKRLEDGEQLNGQYAIALANDANYLRDIAKKALES